jgi:Uma2 family endonuclease
MALSLAELRQVRERWIALVPPRPLTFDEFVAMFNEDDDVELVDGMVIQRMAAELEHEDLFGWLNRLVGMYVEVLGLGIVLGSRTAVRIHAYRARLPDLLFVRLSRRSIVRQKGVYGTPDLVIEILSPTDRPSDIFARELDYRSIGVREIWFVDLPNKRVRILRKRGKSYREEVLTEGVAKSSVLKGFWVRVEWLFSPHRPKAIEVLRQLLGREVL